MRGGRGGCGLCLAAARAHPLGHLQPAGWPVPGMAITSPPWFARRPLEQVGSARRGCVRSWWAGVGGRGGPGRPGGPRPGSGGSGGAPRREGRSVRLRPGARGRPRGRRGPRWRPGCRGCGLTPTAGGCGGRRGRWRFGRAPGSGPPAHRFTRAVSEGRELDRPGWSLALAGLESLEQHRGHLAGWGVEIAPGGPLIAPLVVASGKWARGARALNQADLETADRRRYHRGKTPSLLPDLLAFHSAAVRGSLKHWWPAGG